MRTLLPALALVLGACSNNGGDVVLLYISSMNEVDCQGTIEENFEEANAPEPPESDPDWSWTWTGESSDQLVYASIADGEKDKAYLTIFGQVVPGTRDGKTYTFTWTEVDNWGEVLEYKPSTYRFSEQYVDERTIEFTFERDKETKGLTGHMKITTVEESTWTETDQWDLEEHPDLPVAGRINLWSMMYLEGAGYTNQWETPECEGDDCVLSVKETCAGSTPVRAEWVDYSDAALPALQGSLDEIPD